MTNTVMMRKSKTKLIAILAVLLLVLVSFVACKNKDTNGDNTEVGNSSVVIEDIEDEENESLTSEEYEELESAWSELVSKGDALEIVPVTPSSSTTTSSETSSTTVSSSSEESDTSSSESDASSSSESDASSSSGADVPNEEPDNSDASTSSSDGWYPGDWEF